MKQLATSGQSLGELRLFTVGRRTGKSTYLHMMKTIEEEMANRMANEIAKEIDFGILKELCQFNYEFNFKEHRGVTAINIDPSIMENWCASNCKDGFIHNNGIHWCFKSERDLNWFKLRWL
jgi:hypothetical protein